METLSKQIINCKTLSGLKALNTDNATSLEEGIIDVIIDQAGQEFEDDQEFDIGQYGISVSRLSDEYAFRAEIEGEGVNCTVEGAFNPDDWWEAEWDDFVGMAEKFTTDISDGIAYRAQNGENIEDTFKVTDVEVMEKSTFDERYEVAEMEEFAFNNVESGTTVCEMNFDIDYNTQSNYGMVLVTVYSKEED